MSFRFLGNKRQLLDQILTVFRENLIEGSVVADLFSGTGSVSRKLRESNYKVIANDLLSASKIHSIAQLLSTPLINFTKIENTVDLRLEKQKKMFTSNYEKTLAILNNLPPKKDFFFSEYCPEGTPSLNVPPRNYFTPENAKRIDAIRAKIKLWEDSNLLSHVESALLKHDLILATNRVANIAGTYGHFIKEIQSNAGELLTMRPSPLISARTDHEIYQTDALALAREIRPDAVYIDPPYTKRQYAAYYHILETIAEGDKPNIIGKSGLRPWETKSSNWCYKRKATQALENLMNTVDASLIVMSYSNEGHIAHSDIVDILRSKGTLKIVEIPYRKYRSNNGGNKGKSVKERLYVLMR